MMVGAEEKFIKNGNSGEEDIVRANEAQMRAWLRLHYVRTLVVDLPAVVCFAVGLGHALEG